MNGISVSFSRMSFACILLLCLTATAGIKSGMAGEFHCDSSGEKCSQTLSANHMTIYCMQSNTQWLCTLPVVGNIECSAGSTKEILNRGLWNLPASMCSILCGRCPSGWRGYQGGGSTF